MRPAHSQRQRAAAVEQRRGRQAVGGKVAGPRRAVAGIQVIAIEPRAEFQGDAVEVVVLYQEEAVAAQFGERNEALRTGGAEVLARALPAQYAMEAGQRLMCELQAVLPGVVDEARAHGLAFEFLVPIVGPARAVADVLQEAAEIAPLRLQVVAGT